LTVFTIPKAFQGLNEIIQTNAIRSWLMLNPQPEIILLGKDEGTAETASQLGLKHIADVECNEYGTPLVNSVFEIAQKQASYQLTCYINTDVILLSDFLPAIRMVKEKSFLIIGQRHDLDITELIDFKNPNWELNLQKLVTEKGRLHPPSGIDYFVFNRGLYHDIPPFAVGRTAWDNWLVYQARKFKATLIDATSSITAIHQSHDYSHNPQGESAVWKGPEAIRNKELMGNINNSFDPQYSTRLLTPQGIKRALSIRRVYFQMRAIPVLYSKLYFLLALFKAFEKMAAGVRSKKV
jgi:hypothetical protein